MDDNEKIIIPSPKELEQIEEIDKTKVFWTVVLAIFIVGFVFVLGYWVGQQKSKVNEFRALSSDSSFDIGSLGTPPQETPPISSKDITPIYEGSDLDSLDSSASGTGKIAPGASSREIDRTPIPSSAPPIFDSPTPPPVIRNQAPVKIIPKKPKKPTLTTSNGKWALRLATVKSEKNAQDLRRKLIQMGYSRVNVVKIGVLYRISILGFETSEKAKSAQKKIEQQFRLTDTMLIKL